MKKRLALFSLATLIGLWYVCIEHPQSKKATDRSHAKINNHGVTITFCKNCQSNLKHHLKQV
jgi:hypothetical protein